MSFLKSLTAALVLVASVSSCKQSYASLPSDPQKRIQEVRKADSSELLAQIIIHEQVDEIWSLAEQKLMDKTFIEAEIKKMSQKEIAAALITSKVGILLFRALDDQELLGEVVIKCPRQDISLYCLSKINSDPVLAKILNDKAVFEKLTIQPGYAVINENRFSLSTCEFKHPESICLVDMDTVDPLIVGICIKSMSDISKLQSIANDPKYSAALSQTVLERILAICGTEEKAIKVFHEYYEKMDESLLKKPLTGKMLALLRDSIEWTEVVKAYKKKNGTISKKAEWIFMENFPGKYTPGQIELIRKTITENGFGFSLPE
ncbi:MAG: hypothetical protein RL095_2126 [Verrucomicrobiota bacterium]|jgi:hypothetical protein